MGLREKAWIVLFVAAVVLTIGARYTVSFPRDVPVPRFVQWIAPTLTGWAQWISSTAELPWNLLLLALTAGLSWRLDGWRGAALAVQLSWV